MMPLNKFYRWEDSIEEKCNKYIKFAVSSESDCIKNICKTYQKFNDSAKNYSRTRNHYEALNLDMKNFIEREEYEKAKELYETLTSVKESANQLEKKAIETEEDILFAMDFCTAKVK